jgi:hypothetical protein
VELLICCSEEIIFSWALFQPPDIETPVKKGCTELNILLRLVLFYSPAEAKEPEEKSIFNQKKENAGETHSSSLAHNIITCAVRDHLNARYVIELYHYSISLQVPPLSTFIICVFSSLAQCCFMSSRAHDKKGYALPRDWVNNRRDLLCFCSHRGWLRCLPFFSRRLNFLFTFYLSEEYIFFCSPFFSLRT